MSLIDYDAIVADNLFSKADVKAITDGSNDNHNRISTLEIAGGRDVTKYVYGANIRNFLKKARDWRAGRKFATAPNVVIFGDSITGGDWAGLIKSHLETSFNIPSTNVNIHWYGGYPIINHMPFVDSVLINPNPDLIIFNENEGSGGSGETADNYLNYIESLIYRIRKHTTADIMIGTWSMDGAAAESYFNTSTLPGTDDYEFFNWYRDIASRYNCEVMDFNQAIIDHCDAGNDPTGHYDTVHWDTEWYTNCFYPEIRKHFNDYAWQSAINQPNPLAYKEELLYLTSHLLWDKYKFNNVTIDAQWLRSSQKGALRGTTVGTSIVVDAKNIIGFEVLTDDTYSSSKQYTIEVNDGGGYAAPSTFTPFGKRMEYASEIRSTTYSSNDDLWRLKRMRMMADVTAALGYDNRGTAKRYTMEVTNVVGSPGGSQTVTVDIKNEVGTVLGTFSDLYSDWAVTGLLFPETWNGENNFRKSAADGTFPASSTVNFVVGDEYEFYLRSNWIDQPNTADGDVAWVFGLEPGDYNIRITTVDAGVDIVGIKLYHS